MKKEKKKREKEEEIKKKRKRREVVKYNLKFVIWYSSRFRSLSLMRAYKSFSSTVTVPIPSGLERSQKGRKGIQSREDHHFMHFCLTSFLASFFQLSPSFSLICSLFDFPSLVPNLPLVLSLYAFVVFFFSLQGYSILSLSDCRSSRRNVPHMMPSTSIEEVLPQHHLSLSLSV